MSSLYHFLKEDQKTQALKLGDGPADQLAASAERAVVTSLEDTDVTQDQALKFAKSLVKIIGSDDFLKELSVEIREPGLTESEDAFVARSKATMMKLLDKHLS